MTYNYSGYLKQIMKEKQKFIIFAHHIKMLDAISKYLGKQKVDHIRIDGTTRSDLRSVSCNCQRHYIRDVVRVDTFLIF